MSCARLSQSLNMLRVWRIASCVFHLHKILSEVADGVCQVKNVGEGAFLDVQPPYNVVLLAQSRLRGEGVLH